MPADHTSSLTAPLIRVLASRPGRKGRERGPIRLIRSSAHPCMLIAWRVPISVMPKRAARRSPPSPTAPLRPGHPTRHLPGRAFKGGCRMNLDEELLQIASRNVESLGPVPWTSEADRWTELVFCVLNAYAGGLTESQASHVRSLTDTLRGLGLIVPSKLAEAADPATDTATIMLYIMRRYGLTDLAASGATAALARLGRVVHQKYQGKIQRYLRSKAL